MLESNQILILAASRVYSRMTRRTRTLARPKEIERFLEELANLQSGADNRFSERFPAFIPPVDSSWLYAFGIYSVVFSSPGVRPDSRQILDRLLFAARQGDDRRVRDRMPKIEAQWLELVRDSVPWKTFHAFADAIANEDPHELNSAWVQVLRDVVRHLWKEPDVTQRQYIVFVIRYHFDSFVLEATTRPVVSDESPEPTRFEQALMFLVKAGRRARYCANPECPAPFFFLKRKNQRYCSEVCAAPAQREMKRRWWVEHGPAWRKERRDAAATSKTHRKTAKKGRR